MKENPHIFLVRHGEDQDNAQKVLNGRRDRPLTSRGKKQAQKAAQRLKGEKIDLIYSSPLQRAKQTANIIAKSLNRKVRVKIHPLLIERDFGVLTGKPIGAIPKYSKKTLETDKVTYFLEAEGAESFPELLQRATDLLRNLCSKHGIDQKILLVTHGDVGKMIRAAYYGWGWRKGLKTPYFDNTKVLELKKDHNSLNYEIQS